MRSHPPPTDWVAHRNDPVHGPAGVFRHTEDVEHLVRNETPQDVCPDRADPFGAAASMALHSAWSIELPALLRLNPLSSNGTSAK